MNQLLNLEAWREVVVTALTQLGTTIAGFLPNLIGALVILLLGWCIAKLVEIVSQRLLGRVGIDTASRRIGISETLSNAGISRPPSRLLARVLFWLLMLTFVLSAFDTLGLRAVTSTIDRLIAYLPNIFAAALIVIVGLLIARFVGNLVVSGAAAAGVMYARALGAGARGATVGMVGILAAEQLGVDTRLLITVVTVVVAAAGVALALAFALGAREVVQAVLAGHYLRQSLREGERLEVDGRSGVLQRVGSTETLFHDDARSWSVPNARLLEAVIVRPAAGSD